MSKKGPKKHDPDNRTHWCHNDVLNLVEKIGENWSDFNSGVRKKKFIWKDIAAGLADQGFHVSGEECDRKWRNLKIRYLTVLEKQLNGDKVAHRIDYFDHIHSFLKDDPLVLNYLEQRNLKHHLKSLDDPDEDDLLDTSDPAGDGGEEEWSDKSIQQLLDLLLEFKDWFTDKDNDWDDNTIWETISEQMKLEGHQPSPEQCRNKWSALAQEFQKNKAEAEATGSVSLWPFYTHVRHVLSQVGTPPPPKPGTTPKKSGSTKGKRGRKRTRSQSKTSALPVCKREAPDIDDSMPDDMSAGVPSPVCEMDLPRVEEPPSRSTPGGARRDVIQAEDIREVCNRLEKVEESMAITRRLDSLEAQLDMAGEQRRAQQQTNSLLGQVLNELSALRRTLGARSAPKMAGQDSADLASGITIVVPHSQQL